MAQEQVKCDVQIDSPEFRLLKAYTHKRHPEGTYVQHNSPQRKPSKPTKKKIKKRFSFLRCIKPQTDDDQIPKKQSATIKDGEDLEELEQVASALTEISDSLDLKGDLEGDGLQDGNADVAKQLADILRTQGDNLNEKIQANKVLTEMLQSSFKYSFFQKVLDNFCSSVSSDVPPPQQNDERMNVALICEATSQLSTISYHPMNLVLGFGAVYLQEKYPSWVSRNMHVGNGKVSDESKEEVH